MYFHRTNAARRASRWAATAEEAVKNGFAEQIGEGKVEFHSIDFQDEKNARLTKGYQGYRPDADRRQGRGNKVAEYENLAEIWTKVARQGGVHRVRAEQRPELAQVSPSDRMSPS